MKQFHFLGTVKQKKMTSFDYQKTIGITIIWAVTAYDLYCCRVLTVDNELNPLAKWIIETWGIWALVGFKVFGTYLATELLRYLPRFYTYIIVFLMSCLFFFLTFA